MAEDPANEACEVSQDLAARRMLMALSRMVSAERCGQQPDCSRSTGEVTFQPGKEWQVSK
jgi:hypothetical protein